ncbi:putative tRNA pseudouridine(55) synthase [Helianthus annuus]|nr:putative tRNA pseudouridine(55) synthase [Helianthus annuus]
MAKLNCITRASSIISFLPRPRPTPIFSFLPRPCNPFTPQSLHSYSTTKTPFPLQYELIISRPSDPPPHPHPHRRRPPPPNSTPKDSQLNFDDWVDMKLTSQSQDQSQPILSNNEMDKSKRKYYNKRQKRMYGSDSEDDDGQSNANAGSGLGSGAEGIKKKKKKVEDEGVVEKKDEKGLVFFEESEDVKMDVTEKKVEEFFKCLKKVPNEVDETVPFVSGRSSGLPPKWDGPTGAVLLVNKPKGWTSFTVCGKLRRLVNVKKVGHAGTLDPMATGLLIVCIGKATKMVDRFQGMVKGYSGVLRLGEATSTLDADSPVIQREPWEHIKDDDIKKTAASLTGEIWQVPPMFSAIKVGGERLYEKARRGENIELSPRRISIFEFHVERSLEDRQNVIFRVTCSKGTYIRSLCADFAKALNSCAHMTALRRDSIGDYSVDDAWEFKELEEEIPKSYM